MENQNTPSAANLLTSANQVATDANNSFFQTKTALPQAANTANPGALNIKDYNNIFSEISKIKVDPLRLSRPSSFGAGTEGFHLERYYAHPDANILGINPARFDTEEYYNEHGSVGGDFIRMAKYLPSTAWGFAKDYLEPYSRPSSLFDANPDLEAAHNYHHNMGIMSSSKSGFAGSSVNFFANLAPTIGIGMGVLVEEGALFTAKVGLNKLFPGAGILTKPLEAKAAANLGRIPRMIERGKALKATLGVFSKADNTARLRMIWEGEKGLGGVKGMATGFVKEVNPLKNTIEGINDAQHLRGLAKLSTTFGGYFKDVQRARFAFSEAQVEGGGAVLEKIDSGRQEYAATQQKEIARISKEMSGLVNADNEITDKSKYDKLYNDLMVTKQKFASGPDVKAAQQISTIAEQNGKAVTLLNLPIIYITNAFGFEKMIGHGTVKRTLADQFVKKYGKHLVKSNIAGAAGKASYELIEDNIKRWGKKAYLKHAMMQTPGKLLDYLGKNVPEGIQELFQEGALKGVDHYYTTKYQDPLKFHKGVMGESILVGGGSQYSKEGLEVFLQGMLGGGAMWAGTTMVKSIANPILELGKKTWHGKESYEKYADELNTGANRVLTAAQKAADDPNNFFKLFDKAAGEQINYARVGQVAEALGDEKGQRDIRNDATISYVHTLVQAGQLGVVVDQLKELRELNAEDLANALGENYVEADQAKYFSRLEKSINNAQDLGQRFEKVNEMMPNRYRPNAIDRKKNPAAYDAEVRNYQAHEEGIFFAVYATKTFEETLDRLQGIQEKFAAMPSFAKMPGMRASKIFSVSQMQDDVKSLRTQSKIYEENGEKLKATRLGRQADKLENLANASAVFSTLQSLSGKSSLTAEEKKELEAARKAYAENLAKSNEEKGTEFTIDDLTSQDALDEYEKELKKSFNEYFTNVSMNNENSFIFLTSELDEMFTMYRDWHELGNDNRNMARWVNMLTDPEGFNEFTNNIGVSLQNVYNKRNDILREQKKKFMKGMIQNAFLKKLFEEAKVFVSVEDLEAFEKNDRYPKLIDAKTLEPLKANDPRIPMIEEMFDNYEKVYNKVVKERPIREASMEMGLLEQFFNMAHKDKSKDDKRGLIAYAKALGIDMSKGGTLSIDEVCDFVVNSKFATTAEKKLAQKIKALGTGMKVTFKTNHSAPVTHDSKNGIVIDLRYASPNYKTGSNRAEYLMLKGMIMSLTTDFLDDDAFASEVEEMMQAVLEYVKTNTKKAGDKMPLGLSSPQAFISEVMVNPEFQALLAQVKSTRTPKSSIFNDLIKVIKDFLKKAFKINSGSDTVLKQAVALVGLTIQQSDYLQEPGSRRAPSPAVEAIEDEKDPVLTEVDEEEVIPEEVIPEEKPSEEPLSKNLTPEENERLKKLLDGLAQAYATAPEGIKPLGVAIDSDFIPLDEAEAEIKALKEKAGDIKTEEEIPEVLPLDVEPVVEEELDEEEIDAIDVNTPVKDLPKDLYDLLYAEYKKTAAVAKIKETPGGFQNFVATNSKSSKIIKDWKEAKNAEPIDETPKEEEVSDLDKIRNELFARGWLPEDINGLTEELVINLHAAGTTKEEALAKYQSDAAFVEADKKVAAFIAKLTDNLKNNKVVKVKGGYEQNGTKLPRVSDIVRDILQKKFTNTSAANRGNVLDPIFRDFFDGKLKTAQQVKEELEKLANTVDPESGEKMMKYTTSFPAELFATMQSVKQYLNDKGLKIIGGIPTLFGDIAGPRGGEIDFLVYDKDGNLGIVDLKTSTRNLVDSYNDPADEYQYERGHTIQQLAYRELIRQATGEDIKAIYILPIQLFTTADGTVKNLNTLNTGTEEAPSMLLKLNTSRDIYEVTGYGRPAGSEITRTQEEEDELTEKEKTKQERRIEALRNKLNVLRGQQIAFISSGNITKMTELGDKMKKIIDELKLYGVTVEDLLVVPEETTEETTKLKPEVGMIIKLADGRIVKVKKVSKKQVTVVPLNNEDAIGEILDESVVEDLDKMVVSPNTKTAAPEVKPETEEVMNESKSTAETLSGDKDAQAKLASEAEKMTAAEAQNNFLKNLNNRCE